MTITALLKKHSWVWFIIIITIVPIYYPSIPRMIHNWNAVPNSSHEFLLPLVSGCFAHRAWPHIKNIPAQIFPWSFRVVLLVFLSLGFGIAYTLLMFEGIWRKGAAFVRISIHTEDRQKKYKPCANFFKVPIPLLKNIYHLST